jgi:glycosyltransferase involved in cell wall biosynthesis
MPRKFLEAGHEMVNDNPDVVLNMWADAEANTHPEAKHIMYMRRYELFSKNWISYDWSKIDCLIFVNSWIKQMVDNVFLDKGIQTKTELVYNAVDTSRWKFRNRGHGKKIGMACHIHPKKNLPLAIQILGMLPEDYELHIAGAIQDQFTFHYLDIVRQMRRKVYLYSHIDHSQMDAWWEDKNYCLSTSISEGNPNNVIEAMAKGIKPIIHVWPGAREQFEEWTFVRADTAELMMLPGSEYSSSSYRARVNEKFSTNNYDKIIQIAENLCQIPA